MATRDARIAVFFVSLLLCVALAPAIATGATGQSSRPASLAPAQVEYDDVLLAVDIEADGDASWRIAYRVRLDDDNTTQAFEDLQADIRENPANYTEQFSRRMDRTAASASNATGREMSIRNVTVAAETEQLPREYGVVTYRFTWTNFAAVDGERLRAGDAIGGFFLDESTTLLFTWPEGYRLESVTPRDSATVGTDRVTWSGPLEFTDGEPRLVLAPGAATGEPTTTPDTAGGLPLAPVVGITLLLALGVAGFLYTRRRPAGGPDSGGGSGPPADGGDSGDGPADGADAGAVAAGAPADDAGSGTDEDGPPAELLSNEEQVLKLLEDNGGRMKQQQVVAELDWTEAKTSQVIGGMREEGEVETFRIGRENVVTLPDEEI